MIYILKGTVLIFPCRNEYFDMPQLKEQSNYLTLTFESKELAKGFDPKAYDNIGQKKTVLGDNMRLLVFFHLHHQAMHLFNSDQLVRSLVIGKPGVFPGYGWYSDLTCLFLSVY
jgi:hypothetical protein